MWDRSILKSNAKLALRGRYWTAFAVSLVAMLISGAFSLATAPARISYQSLIMDPGTRYAEMAALSGQNSLISIGSILFAIFVTYPVVIGLARFYVQNRFGVTDFGTLFSGFRRSYLNGVGAMFVTQLFIGLWTLLLIIPGIVKSLEYSMVHFILSDNPAIPGGRAREISRILTRGEKGAIFVLMLSFLGWFILGTICLGVGILFVMPYYEATMAELYIFLRDRAIQSGQLNPAELGLVAPAPYDPNL
jgi:Predicted integral membrane protein